MSRIKRVEYFDGRTHHTIDIEKKNTDVIEELPGDKGVVQKNSKTGKVKMKIINMPVVIHYDEEES